MTFFTGYWLTRGRPHCIARWPSSSTESTSSPTREPNDSTNGPTAKLGQRSRRRLGASSREAGQAREHGVRLLEPNVRDLGAVARVPPQPRAPEPPRIVHQQEDELERVRKLTKSSSVAVANATVAFCESRARRKRA